uniref:Uncharacterized protein n=1 Tax=Anopheles culicifacies TaxID=139723 RepID=A0A182LUF1_9DIPT
MFRPPVRALPLPTIAILPCPPRTIRADCVEGVGKQPYPGPPPPPAAAAPPPPPTSSSSGSLPPAVVQTSPHLDVADERHCELAQQPIYHHHHNHHHHHHSIPAGPPILQSVNTQVVAPDAILLPPHRLQTAPQQQQHHHHPLSLLASVDAPAPYLSRRLFVDRYLTSASLNVPFLTGAEHRMAASSIGATVGGSASGLH